MEALAEAAWRGGFTALLCYTDVDPVPDQAQVLRGLARQAQQLPVQLWLTGRASEAGQGQELAELYDMTQAGAMAFTDGLHRPANAGAMLRTIQYLRAFDGLLILPAMDPQLVPDGQMNEGTQSARLGMKGIPEVAERMAIAADLELLSYQPGRVHYQPLTSPQALSSLHAFRQTQSMPLSTGLPLYYLIHDDRALESYDTFLKVMPPLRATQQVAQLRQALKEGKIDVLTTGHRAQGPEEKQLEFTLAEPGMLALQTFYPLVQQHLIEPGWITEADLVQLVSHRPREILRQPLRHITEGQPAELTFFDPEKVWTLRASDIPSRAKNSPYLGRRLQGQVWGVMTPKGWQLV